MIIDIYELGLFYAFVAIAVFVALWVRMVSQVIYVEKRKGEKKHEK